MMRRALRILWSIVGTTFLAVVLFFAQIEAARAPQGGKSSLGGRTIASMQETEFDRRLLRYHLCYGVSFNAEKATLERRRVCKALVVNRLEVALSRPGAYLKGPLEFQCEDTMLEKPRAPASEDFTAVVLKPNQEFVAIDQALSRDLDHADVAESVDLKAKGACEFLTDCKWATRPDSMSFRKLASCFTTKDLVRRKILLDEVGTMLFHPQDSQNKLLYTELLESR